MTSEKMANTMDSMLSAFGTNMAQMGIKIESVNAVNTAAVNGVTSAFNAFTEDTSAYALAVAANADKQAQEIASWTGPVSDVLTSKLAETWTTLTTAGEATVIENMMLDKTGDLIAGNLANLDETTTALPGQIGGYVATTNDAIDSAVGNVTTQVGEQSQTLGTDISAIPTAIKDAVSSIGVMIQYVIDAIGATKSTTTTNSVKTSSSSTKKTTKSQKTKGNTKTDNKSKSTKKSDKSKKQK